MAAISRVVNPIPPRDRMVTLRITSEQHEWLKEKAEALKTSMEGYIRACVFRERMDQK